MAKRVLTAAASAITLELGLVERNPMRRPSIRVQTAIWDEILFEICESYKMEVNKK